MYYKLSECILQGDKLAPRSIGAFWNGREGCGLGRALLATGWPMEIPFIDEEVESQWTWLTKVNPEGNGGTFGADLSRMFNRVFYNEMSIEEYADIARRWEELHDDALIAVEIDGLIAELTTIG